MPHHIDDPDNRYNGYTRQESDGWACYIVVSNPRNGPDKPIAAVRKLPDEQAARDALLTISRKLGIEVPAP